MILKRNRDGEAGRAAGKSAVAYLTSGSLLLIWSVIGLFFVSDTQDGWGLWHYALLGFLLTGVVFVALGATIGKITRSARDAEMPREAETHMVETRPTPPEARPDPPEARLAPEFTTHGSVETRTPPH